MRLNFLLLILCAWGVTYGQLPGEQLLPLFPAVSLEGRAPATSLRNGEVDPILAARLQDTLEVYRDKASATGLSAAMIFPGGEIWAGASGINAYPAILLTPEDALGMGSITKTITSAAILKLWEMGELQLDDPLSAHLGAYPNVDGDITLLLCLKHTSGINNYSESVAFGDQIFANPTKFWTPDEILNQYVSTPTFLPGTGWEYSNTNYLLLGLVVEAASGVAYHEFVREHLLIPAGVPNITLGSYEAPTDPRAHAWLDAGFGKVDVLFAGLSLEALFSSAWAAGAYWATPTDVGTWVKALVHGDILQPASKAMMKDVIELLPELAYGAGLIRFRFAGIEGWGHGGNIIYKSLGLYIPSLDLTTALMSNDNDYTDDGPATVALIQGWLDFNTSTEYVSPELMKVQLYPNPSTIPSALSGLKKDMEIQLVNGEGQLLGYSKTYQDHEEIQLAQLFPTFQWEQSGIYFIHITYAKTHKTIPMILQVK